MSKLMWLFLVPLLGSLFTFVSSSILGNQVRRVAIAISLVPLVMLLVFGVNGWVGNQVSFPWVSPLGIHFDLKMDSLALLFVALTAVLIPITLCSVKNEGLVSPHAFYGFVLLLEALLIGFFTAYDLALFVIFWEAMLFPIYFIITMWGKRECQAAALKFLVYMIAGSFLLVAALLALYVSAGSFDLAVLAKSAGSSPYAKIICAVFILAFAVKTPLFPFHAWLPETYYEASTPGTILLSSLLSKAGIFGFLRVSLELFPDLMKEWSPFLLGWAIAGVLYGGLAAWMQNDYKRLLAYSSFSHVNFVLAGLFVVNQTAHEGAALQALNHGVTIAALFLVAGWLEDRLGNSAIGPVKGVAKFFPQLCWLTMIFVLSSVALPGTNNFIGELLILFGVFDEHPILAFLLGLSVILSVMYMLRWMQNVYFSTPLSYFQSTLGDIKFKEYWVALPLVALVFWIGLYPAPLLNQVADIFSKVVEAK